jgi:N-acyl-D-aspartate/D-glutamate deacylase
VIDAEGHVVSPGFIDGHTHMDAQVMWDVQGTCSCWHGVTSVVMGNCGFSLAPVRDTERGLVVRNLERAEDISADAMAAGIEWSWEAYPEYLDVVEARPKAINYAAYIGHSALRTWAMGERAFEAESTDDDLELMEHALHDAMRAGAIGFSTSRANAHRTSDDRPVSSRLATWDEVCRLVHVMGNLGAGVFEIAPDSYVTGVPDEPKLRSDFWDRMFRLALETNVPATFGVILGLHRDEMLDVLDRAAIQGAPMFGQCTARELATLLSFETKLPFDPLPVWSELRSLPLGQQQARLRDPDRRRQLVEAAIGGTYHTGAGPEVRPPDYERTYILERPTPPNRSLAEVAAERGVHPVDVVIDEALATDLKRIFMHTFGNLDQELVLRAMKHPRTVTTFSDSGAHVSQIIDASIPTYLLRHWVHDRQELALEEAIRMLTLVPARSWGFSDRGLVREGMVADLNVFDPERIGPDLPTVVSDLPGGATRLEQRAHGFLATVVSGEVTLRDGEPTGALPGRLIRGPAARS